MALPNSVIYFPYIQVAPVPFMTRLLLYWSDVATIVPDQWAYKGSEGRRQLLGDFTCDLVDAGLVTMAVPTYEMNESLRPFVAHLMNLSAQDQASRSTRFREGGYVLVHKGKFVLENLIPQLREMELLSEAQEKDVAHLETQEYWDWMLVENTTAREFMAVLAQACADQAPGIEYLRVWEPGGNPEHDDNMRRPRVAATNRPQSLLALAEVGEDQARDKFLTRLQNVRTRLLDDLFPSPAKPVTAEWIVAVKTRYEDLLTEFRLMVEREAFNLAQRDDDPVSDWNINLVSEELNQGVRRIEEILRETPVDQIEKITFAMLKAIPGVGTVFSAAQEIADAATDNVLGRPTIDTRLAYGAFLRRELEGLR